MKKVILIAVFCISLQFSTQAQVTFSEPEVIVSVINGDFDVAAHNTVTNSAIQVKTYRWERNVMNISDDWASAVCDKNACYVPDTGSAEFTMGPAESGATMDVHVYPGAAPASDGSATIEVNIIDVNTEQNVGSAIYYFNASPSSTVEVSKESVRVYPNPSTGIFSLKGGESARRIAIFNVTGQRLKLFDVTTKNSYDIRDLPRGTYFVQLLSKDAQVLTTKLIQKI